ncbi:TPA: hypothetical protein N0F65_002173 [Lagenidium giganteum]|uniref:Uncharacterized protein n=1 Tax=Lagenidium giganteum TaxID=4803 RepID=A0AAV2YGN1_9STRA|nr:TPA: hypothetical protein N0F65_002173 [Lagenidium giganteum]
MAATTNLQALLHVVQSEGRIVLAHADGDVFRYTLTSDKIETRLEVQSKISKRKWEVHANDAALGSFGPADVDIPRAVVVSHLKAALEGHTDAQHLALEEHDGAMDLTLTLRFSPLFAPVYTLPLLPVPMQSDDVLRSFIHDLQEELAELKATVKQLEQQLEDTKTASQTDAARMEEDIRALRQQLGTRQLAVSSPTLHNQLAMTKKRMGSRDGCTKPRTSQPARQWLRHPVPFPVQRPSQTCCCHLRTPMRPFFHSDLSLSSCNKYLEVCC